MTSIFITGTDTNVGKTIISSWLCLHLRATYWKPVQTGKSQDSDIARMLTQGSIKPTLYSFPDPISPHVAAEKSNHTIDLSMFILPTGRHIIEGIGGVLVPLAPQALLIDLIHHLSIPTLIVARNTLGTINHTLLTIEALRARHIPILGVILNGDDPTKIHLKTIQSYGRIPYVFEFPHLTDVSYASLMQVDFQKLFQHPELIGA